MIKFSLTRSKRKALPEAVEVGGNAFSINASFRTVLRILALWDDDDVPDAHKPHVAIKLFYDKGAAPSDPSAALDAMMRFVSNTDDKRSAAAPRHPAMDYEQDAEEIYASFLALYGIDLLDSDMHWYQFCALLSGAVWAQSPIGEKVRRREELRTADASKAQDPAAVREAQDAISIKPKTSRAEQELKQTIQDILTSGGDVAAKLEAFKNGL